MLYGTSSHDQDRDLDLIPGGLGAVSPSRRPGVVTGGGGYHTSGSGGGGAPGAGETAVGGSRTATYRPVDRNTLVAAFARIGQARYAFQKSGRGSKAPFEARGLSGLDSWLSDRFTPPGGKLSRVQLIPQNIRKAIPQPIRKIVRYGGAGVQSVFAPILSGSQQRRIFGLDANESGVFMKTQQVSRIAIATILTFGGTKALLASRAASTTALGPGVGPSGLQVALPATHAASAPLTAAGLPGAAGSGSLIASAPAVAPAAFGPVGFGAAGAAKGGLLAQFATGVGSVAKAIGIGIGAQVILGAVAPRPGSAGDAAPTTPSGEPVGLPYNPPGGKGDGGQGGSGDSSSSEGSPVAMLASPGGLIVGGLVVGAIYAAYKRRR